MNCRASFDWTNSMSCLSPLDSEISCRNLQQHQQYCQYLYYSVYFLVFRNKSSLVLSFVYIFILPVIRTTAVLAICYTFKKVLIKFLRSSSAFFTFLRTLPIFSLHSRTSDDNESIDTLMRRKKNIQEFYPRWS